jgi:tetratricopeptide (TPR) repeat protein
MKTASGKIKCFRALAALFLGIVLAIPAMASRKDSTRNAEWYYEAGLALYQKANYEDALVRFEQALDENFDYWQSYQMIGNCHYNLRNKEKALAAFEQSLRINPSNLKLAGYYQRLKTGKVCLQLMPEEYNPQPVGTPVVITQLLISSR